MPGVPVLRPDRGSESARIHIRATYLDAWPIPIMTKVTSKAFEPLEEVTEQDIVRIVKESLERDFKVYDRLAEI